MAELKHAKTSEKIGAYMPSLPTKKSIGLRLIRRGLRLHRGSATISALVREPDGVWTLERGDFDDRLQAFQGRETGQVFNAEGIGGDPGSLLGTPVAVGYRRFGTLLSLPGLRIARNWRTGELGSHIMQGGEAFGGWWLLDCHSQTPAEAVEQVLSAAPESAEDVAAVADGGTKVTNRLPGGFPTPERVTAEHGDIAVESAALVRPEDVSLLQEHNDRTEQVETVRQESEEAARGPSGMMDSVKDYGMTIMMLLLGWWMGSQTAGGGGGGGSSGPSIPFMHLDISGVVPLMTDVLASGGV